MRQSDATAAIFSRWLTLWPSLQPTVAFAFDNDDAAEALPFARVAVLSLDSEIYTLGPLGTQQRKGYIDVRLETALDIGRKLGDQLVDSVRAIYERVRFASGPGEDGIITHATVVSELRRDRDGVQMWVVQAVTPFEFYGTSTA